MRIEAFTQAKRHGEPDTNEDAMLLLPGRAFAVMDGVTDRVGTRYDGMLAGRFAAQLLARTLAHLLSGPAAPLADPATILDAASAAIRAVYDAHGTTQAVHADPNRQMAATLALVTLTPDTAHILLVGDSGIRLDGDALWQDHKDIDAVTATLRRLAWATVAPRTADPAQRERISRAVAWSGTGHAAAEVAPLLTPADLRAIAHDALAACRTTLPHLPEPALAAVIDGGIIHAQGGHANDPASPFGYPSLNGFPIPPAMVRTARFPRATLRTVELFTDGYFAPGDAFGIASWEAKFHEIEQADPHKIAAYPSVKGTTATQWADDRTYLGVEL